MSLKLPQRPAFCSYHNSFLIVSTYQLESADSRVGALYFLSPALEICRKVELPAGVFRFQCPKPNLCISALTDGSLCLTSLDDFSNTFIESISTYMLLDVSFLDDKVLTTDNKGTVYLVDVAAQTTLASKTAHRFPYTTEECEVWTCALSNNIACSGGEDAVLRLWDPKNLTPVNTIKCFEAGVTFSKWIDDNTVTTGSYDQHIRVFDIRNTKEPVKDIETDGGVWHIDSNIESDLLLASCMYGGFHIFDKAFNSVKKDVTAGQQLLYGATFLPENSLAFVTFNDFSVHLVKNSF